MRGVVIALLLAPWAFACGGDEGILVSVSQDPISVPERVKQLEFFVGIDTDGDPGTPFVRDPNNLELGADVSDHDLTTSPYKLLLHDGGPNPPSTVIVAVVGRRDDVAIAFGGWTEPQSFMPGVVVERPVVLTGAVEGADFVVTTTGCLSYAGIVIASPYDRDCDEDPVTSDCDDDDPARASTFDELCGNGIDDDCDPATADDSCGECASPADCQDLYGPPPCGVWECKPTGCSPDCPDCQDADGDRYGVDLVQNGCIGPDCDDGDPAVGSDAVQRCYEADGGTDGVGVCHGGTETCAGGVWSGLCVGQVIPSGEACNAQDDDCDGQVDDGLGVFTCGVGACQRSVAACAGGMLGTCSPLSPGASLDTTCNGVDDDCDGAIDEDCGAGCVRVTPSGNDTVAATDGNLTPFQTIQAAINWASSDPARPRNVCVAAASTCGAGSIGSFVGAVTMAEGINLYGSYESTTWTRCSSITTFIAPGVADGVLFPSSIGEVTVIDGFRIDRAALPTTAGITIDGATNVIVSNVVISNTPSSVTSRGILLKSGADALITGSSIDAGNGSSLSVAIHSMQARPTIALNCGDVDPATGRCDTWCGSAPGPAIRGRQTPGPAGSQSYAVVLDESPGAIVSQSALCGGDADVASVIRIGGDATGTLVTRSFVQMWGGLVESHGVWMDACGGAAPWIVDNHVIMAVGDNSGTAVDAVRAIGDCHPVIDNNALITGGDEGGTSGAVGVHCGADGTGASRCVILGNPQIQGSQYGFPPSAIGVRCDGGACMRIAGNTITGNQGVDAWGLWLDRTGAFVDDNAITGGCATLSATGVQAIDSWARLQNNRISSGACNMSPGGSGAVYTGMRVLSSSGPAEVDVHSNDLDARGPSSTCTSVGLSLGVAAPAVTVPEGVFRNNIIRGGNCSTNFVVVESDTRADPRLFENNDLDPFSAPIALYFDENTMALTDPADVNMLAGAWANFSADPMYVNFPSDLHIFASSPCANAGTDVGAPLDDMDGHPRDATPDVGADEL